MKSVILLPLSLLFSLTAGITLNRRSPATDGPPRVLRLSTRRNVIPDPAAHDLYRWRGRRHLLGKRDGGVLETALDNQISLYALNITIGTPPQDFSVSIDTGSSDLWINAAGSRLCDSRGDPCSSSGSYSANDSSTYSYVNGAFNISYAGGDSATGDYVTDQVTVAGFTLDSLQFGIGYESSSPLAILGIGYPLDEAQATDSSLQPYRNLPAQLVKDGAIASNAYSIWLNDLEADTGSLLFGGVDRAQYEGDLVSVPIATTGGVHAEFFVALTDVQLDGESLSSSGSSSSSSSSSSSGKVPALLDTGTSLTYLPNDMVVAIYESVDAVFDEKQGVAIVACDLAEQEANVTYTFNDAVSINVPLRELVLASLDPSSDDSGNDSGGDRTSACQFGIAPAGQDSVILGDTFMRSAYVVFDLANNEISLAQSRFDATGSDIAEIVAGQDGVSKAETATATATIDGTVTANPTATETDADGAGVSLRPSMMGLVVLGAVALCL